MATTKFYLDIRTKRADGTFPLKIVITRCQSSAWINLNVRLTPKQWDKTAGEIKEHPNKNYLNSYIRRRRSEIESFILHLIDSGEIAGMKGQDIKNAYMSSIESEPDTSILFENNFIAFINTKQGRTRQIYEATLSRLRQYCKNLSSLKFDDITYDWLYEFDRHLSKTSPAKNARNIHMRNIRAVFNAAIASEVSSAYPFRRFKIQAEKTRKRSLNIAQLRDLFNADVAPHEQRYLDCFKLIFMLCGINIVDLCHLKAIEDGRVEYTRAKTHKQYSVKVEPEAYELLNKYKGEKNLLNYLDTCKSYRIFYGRLCMGLKAIATNLGLTELSTYWARHSWATIAASLDIPKETIAAALGHGGNTVTDIYIDFDQRKVDEANRRVLDWVLYGKK